MKSMPPQIYTYARLFVGIAFAISGIAKSLDIFSSSLKVQEYFEVFNTTVYGGVYDIIAGGLVTVEILLGLLLILGIFKRLVAKISFAVMVFFLLLTLYVYVNNSMQECGCFGDVFSMSIKETCLKNIILTLACGIMLCESKKNGGRKIGSFSVCLVIAVVLGFYGLFVQPIHNASPYSVGHVLTKEELGIDSNWGYNMSLSSKNDQEDISVLIIMRNFEKREICYIRKIEEELCKRYRINDNGIFLLTATPLKEITECAKNKNIYNIDYNFSKKIIHANVGVVVLKGNIIQSKWQQNFLHLQRI
ncbi:MauE/DoxX family redox-associated membrane protein [uncultured Prevotella sp.]|uniref:MauE/DoxX family redox-associated membrane protein n=1 Tax=uncultured Prevotella sp. TaxID=159272 RepID=UPI00260D5773|nr:MauE/DoxX family redox-associated membrane protein [uncultured Prevotella sp.]